MAVKDGGERPIETFPNAVRRPMSLPRRVAPSAISKYPKMQPAQSALHR
jgi:hypothetical protein